MFAVLLIYITHCIMSGYSQNFAVRLNNSLNNNSKEGRLEIFYSGIWGTVCNDGFTNVDARVACASLGWGYIGATIGRQYGAGSGQIWLDDVNCNGHESGIEQCVHPPWGQHNCDHTKDISITCCCDCDRDFFGPTGQISSPNFPMAYHNDLYCSSYIIAPTGQTIIITFQSFNTENQYDWVTITCESGKTFTPTSFSGSELPTILTIISCNRVKVSLQTDYAETRTGFSLIYNITSDNVMGGISNKPSNMFPRSGKNDSAIFNCTTAAKYLPWWTTKRITGGNITLTNSTCGVIVSASYSSWFKTETLGPGSCNLIVVAPAASMYLVTGSFLCTDSTLSTARALLAPINLELRLTKGVNSSAAVTDIMRDEEIRISCNPSFPTSSSLIFTYSLYSGGPLVQMRIMSTYWTSQGNVVPSNNTANSSSYVLVKAPAGSFPRYTCNIVYNFISNISDITGNSSIEISVSTENVEVLYWPTEDDMRITGDYNGQILPSALLLCDAAANPQATYTWIDESNGNITKGPTIIINHGGKYTCTASNIIRGQYYQQPKSVILQVVEDDTNRLKLAAIILGALLGAAVLTIVILAFLLFRKSRQPKPNSDVGHINQGNEHELQHNGRGSNRCEYDNAVREDVAKAQYENLDDSQRLANIPTVYEELRKPR